MEVSPGKTTYGLLHAGTWARALLVVMDDKLHVFILTDKESFCMCSEVVVVISDCGVSSTERSQTCFAAKLRQCLRSP